MLRNFAKKIFMIDWKYSEWQKSYIWTSLLSFQRGCQNVLANFPEISACIKEHQIYNKNLKKNMHSEIIFDENQFTEKGVWKELRMKPCIGQGSSLATLFLSLPLRPLLLQPLGCHVNNIRERIQKTWICGWVPHDLILFKEILWTIINWNEI